MSTKPPDRKNDNEVYIDDEIESDISSASNILSSAKSEGIKQGDDLASYIEDIASTVRSQLDQSIAILTPWFFSNMPQIYYQSTPRSEKVKHLSAVITGHVFESKQTIELWDRQKSKVTYIGPGDDGDILTEMAAKVKGQAFKSATLYFSKDRQLFLSSFFTSDHVTLDLSNSRIRDKIDSARRSLLLDFPDEADLIEKYLSSYDNDFVTYATDARIHITYKMYRYMLTHEGAHTLVVPFVKSNKVRLTLGFKHESASDLLEEILTLIQRYGFEIARGTVVSFSENKNDLVTIMHFSVSNSEALGKDKPVDTKSINMIKLNKALRTLAWVDVDEYTAFTRSPYNLSINSVNLLRAMACWAHVTLSKDNIFYYSSHKIFRTLNRYDELRVRLVDLFRSKFDPILKAKINSLDFENKASALFAEISTHVMDDVEKAIYRECIRFVRAIDKTNYFMQTKTGLAFKINPSILDKNHYPQEPFGIYFIVGRDYRLFHVRWKDIARGGVRVVMPRSNADYDSALAGVFDEVYGLSYAQQLKNKDIPEGGSKAVVLLKPGGNRVKAVKGAVNAMLDLLLVDDEAHESKDGQIINYYEKDEIIYLGPDENITNDLIEWIPNQAERRGYKYALAFMSSKPDAGINHKQYGVTSEGVNVYVDNILKFLNIDPKTKKFSVKITGGPDGDVAGNELKILHREYGNNAQVVAIADGYGAAYDAEGLDWTELMRLVEGSLAINHFNSQKLKSKDSFVIVADGADNIKIRNELHYKVYADVFIPAGGRPYTVNDKTVSMFLVNGKPSCRAIVEGANIFFTSEARNFLQKHGVFIIKDSSANKTGVICSSYEIIASLTLTKEEFLEVKDQYVKQVIEKLKEKADLEAKLLLNEFSASNGQKTLVDLSLEISKEINSITDSLLDELTIHWQNLSSSELIKSILLRHCPKILGEKYSERIFTKLPTAHKIAIVSSFIASYIVYQEGLGWMLSDPKDKCFRRSLYYMEQDLFTQKLIESVENSGLENKDKIKMILEMSAARNLTENCNFKQQT